MNMYRGPIAGAGAGGTVGLAYTGFNAISFAVVALILIVAGLALVRTTVIRRNS
jgi:hypothetical protein